MPSLSLPLFDLPDPTYFRGSAPLAVAASYSGAVAALVGRGAKLAHVRSWWTVARTMQDVAALTGYPLASVCSLKKCLGADLQAAGWVYHTLPDGRQTRRVLWKVTL